MGAFDDYESYDAVGLAELVRQGQTTPEALLEAAIERVEASNPELNAVVAPRYDEARRCIRDGLPEGPLRGVPFLLKDLGLLYKGLATTFGSRLFTGLIAGHDSTLVARYRQAGLVMFGKTNTPEFGITVTTEPALYGPCRNPWNLERTTGGSSGGAAAAVAAGMVPAAHASDGGGSIRIPAACCGLFGLKPTRARIPAGPDTARLCADLGHTVEEAAPVFHFEPFQAAAVTIINTDTAAKLYSFFGFTHLFNATGQPAMSLPLYWTPDGLPVGLQFAGRFGDEALLLRMASQLEQARPWKDRRPKLRLHLWRLGS